MKKSKDDQKTILVTQKEATVTRLEWKGDGEHTVWLSINGIEDNRIPIVVTEEQMHAIVTGSRKVNINITITTDGNKT